MAIDWEGFLNEGLGAVTSRVVKEIEGDNEVIPPAAAPQPVQQTIDRNGGIKTLPVGAAQPVGFGGFAGVNQPLLVGSVALLAVALIVKAVK